MKTKMTERGNNVCVILHNIRSVHNVGSIFRTADAAGVSKIYTTGYTPGPRDRFGRARRDFAKVALGAEATVSHEHCEDIFQALQKLRADGVQIISIEQHKNALSYKKVGIQTSHAFIFGNEVEGIGEDILRASDTILEIPMHGNKESLNVSVAVGVILFHFVM
ncbi:MAG: tRNA/rRNA methyltransferase (spou) [Parcubacteria group bacterium Gr01-1014_48]|nr:MAG: tRNA/rRNA methyltransferase (spou) [Parcubacteria group bacterium Greene0416_14]TSC73982.1 MAG: tRNA/rRNA methyltransferase (spou) [Parcubacteria group bacterium Gr01-1014_48]TSD00453.1 MAG: tRNA/rRNA methyltransferase (spou) [Parcubacteria group bacterium Greene1014_15]TSD07873.1 MAG: tRNA/rRNA methyltransferase (spou) [Parcubacteria group bacterium Greene0714_4]